MSKPFFYPSIVLDNEDPLMLGRVRARVLTDNYNDITDSITNPVWNEEKDRWTSRDPFVFLPLLPYFIYQVPKNNELIYKIISEDKGKKVKGLLEVIDRVGNKNSKSFEILL